MRQPPGFVDPDRPQHICRLVKALYGLKQAPRAWHARLGSALRAHGFVPSTTDTSLFILQRPEVTMYILVYVDDIILVSSSVAATDRLVLLSLSRSTLRISCDVLACWSARLLLLPCPRVRLFLLLMGLSSPLMMLPSTEALLGLFSTLPSHGLIFRMQLTVAASIFMPLESLT